VNTDPSTDSSTDSNSGTDTGEAFVHVDGLNIVDGSGQPILLRTMGLGNWLLPEGYMWLIYKGSAKARELEARITEILGEDAAEAFWLSFRERFFTEADVQRAKALGYNSIRLALNARLLMPENGTAFDEVEFERLEQFVNWCETAGLYVIFDMHAAPGGQTGHNAIDDSPTDTPELFNSEEHQTRLITLWTEIARRFSQRTAVLGYDLLNEPINPDFASLNDKLWPLYVRIAAEIRTVDTDHIIIVEGAGWANNWDVLDAPFDDNMIYSFHKYWDNTDQASIQRFINKGIEWNRPIWCGEMGEPKTPLWSQNAVQLLESNNIGWTFWPWKKMSTTNTPYSIRLPENWTLFHSYGLDPTTTPRPTAEEIQPILDEFLENISLANCDYIQAITCEILPDGCNN